VFSYEFIVVDDDAPTSTVGIVARALNDGVNF
jgi:hypothetical protein